MKNNRWTHTHTFLKLSFPFYILLLFSLSSISHIAVIHAASLACFPFCTLTATPTTAMPTATPNIIPTPTLISTAMPTLTPTPVPILTPTSRPTLPVNAAPPVEPIIPEILPTATPMDTPSATATTVTTTVIVTATAHTTTKTTTPSTKQQQDTADKGFNPVLLSLGIGIPLVLATGGIFWFLWRRQTKRYMSEIYPNTQVSPWMTNYVVPPTLDPQYPSLSMPGVSGALPIASIPPMLSPQPTYTPTSDFHPAVAHFSREMLTASLNNGSSAQNSLLPLLVETSSLSAKMRTANRSGQTTPLSPMRMDTPPPSMSSLPSATSSPMPPLVIHPPLIKEDPMLEEVMRQAQMGLFILSGR